MFNHVLTFNATHYLLIAFFLALIIVLLRIVIREVKRNNALPQPSVATVATPVFQETTIKAKFLLPYSLIDCSWAAWEVDEKEFMEYTAQSVPGTALLRNRVTVATVLAVEEVSKESLKLKAIFHNTDESRAAYADILLGKLIVLAHPRVTVNVGESAVSHSFTGIRRFELREADDLSKPGQS